MRLRWLGCLLCVVLSRPVLGQRDPVKYYEIIQGDSIRMFFSPERIFVEKKCAQFMRFTRVDGDGNYNGHFRDVHNDGTPFGKGHYVHGVKHGHFEFFYPNGKVNGKGNYNNNLPDGRWDFYYENGSPERTLFFNGKDTLLLSFVNSKGKATVTNGSGHFEALVTGVAGPLNSIVAKGKVVNGKPDGQWTATLFGDKDVYRIEEYRDGKMISGYFPDSLTIDWPLRNRAALNTFFLDNYLQALEVLRPQSCNGHSVQEVQQTDSLGAPFRSNQIASDMGRRIDMVLDRDIEFKQDYDYTLGDNYLTIQFSTDEKGKARDFVLITPFGHRFLQGLSGLIRSQKGLPPNMKTMFFHMKLHFPGGAMYSYQYAFSFRSLHDW